MQNDIRELKKSAFLQLREAGHTYSEIKGILNVSERSLYNWSNELDDEQFEGEQQQAVEVSEREQQLQNQINELSEHLERLSNSYTRLWNQVHFSQDNVETEHERAYRTFFEVMFEGDRKRQAVLSQQLARCHQFEEELKSKEGRPSAPDTYRDLHFNENVANISRWNRDIDIRSGRVPTDVGGVLDLEVPLRDENKLELYCDTVECRGFEKRISDRCFERSTRNILDGL